MNQDLITAALIVLFSGVLGKFNTYIVDAFKRFSVFANSSPATKRAVALVGAALVTWASTHLGLVLNPDLTQLGPTDVYRVVIAVLVWLSSMVIHDGKKA